MPHEELSPPLSRYIRFRDLVACGIVGNWMQLHRMMDAEGFPPGYMLSPNVRAWKASEVEAWLAARPTARKQLSEANRKAVAQAARRRYAAEHEEAAR